MTILPKKKAEEESDSDDASGGCPHNSSPHGAAGHDPLNSPNSPEEVVGFHNADGFYHRCMDILESVCVYACDVLWGSELEALLRYSRKNLLVTRM